MSAVEINESTTFQAIGRLIPPNTTLSISCLHGFWTAALTGGSSVLTGAGENILEATANLVFWLAVEKRCPHCGEFNLHKLQESKNGSWKCVTCGKDYTPDLVRKVILNPWDVANLQEAKLFVEQNPKHPVCSGWSDLIYEVEDCGEEFFLEVFQEELQLAEQAR